ncbi:MAG: PAS domain S-box protein, partial [Halodesulfurarchaeum sp.]
DGYLLTVRDRSDRRRFFETLTETSPDLIYFKDREHRLVHAGHSFADILDAEPSELTGKTPEELWPQDLAADVIESEKRVLAGEPVLNRERKITHADGTEHWYSVNKIPRFDETGEVIGYFGIDREITDRKRNERKLRLYRQAVESSTDMLAASDRDREYLFANRRYRKFHGIDQDENVRGLANEAVLGEELLAEIEPYLERVYNGESVSFEMQRPDPRGVHRTLDVRFSPLEDEDGRIVGDLTALRDVTDRKQQERELREKTERLDLAIEGADLGVWDWDMRTGRVRRNEQWAAMLGYELEEIENRLDGWEYLLHPDDLEPHDEALERHLAGEAEFYTVDYRLRTKSGDWRWVRNIGKVLEWEGERPMRAVGIHQDIDEQKRNERELEQAQKRLRQVIDLVPDPIFAKNRDGEYLLANESMAILYDREPEELIGLTDRDLGIPEKKARTFRNEDLAVIDSGDSKIIPERTIHHEAGERRVHQTVLIPYDPVGSEEEGVLGYARDITNRKEYERQVEVQRDTLEILNQVVRHDIRNDLQLILAYTEMVLDHVDEDGEEHARTALSAATSAIEITETARDVADVVLQSTADLSPTSLPETLETVVSNARDNHGDATITIDGSLPAVEVKEDGLLDSLFRNLLQNAVVHNDKDDPQVTLSATREDDRVRVAVADNGPGIPPEQREEIFQKGEKGLESEGTGLGLYLVTTLVDRYGGAVSVEANDPGGSVFVVELPVVE